MAGVFNILLTMYSAARLLITLGAGIYIIGKGRIKASRISLVTVFVMMFVLMENVVRALNGSLYINFAIGSVSLIGFALLCQASIQSAQEDYIWACKHLFGLFSIVGALQIIAMPNGFFNDSYKAFAVYFLGAKNTSFFYYAVFLYFVFYDDISKYRRIRKRSIAFVGLFVVAALKCDSMNTLMMMIIILGFIIVINYAQILRRLIKPPDHHCGHHCYSRSDSPA